MHAALHSRLPPHNAGSHPTRRAAPLLSVPFVRAHRYINQRQTQTAEVRGQRSRRRQAHRTERGLCKPAPLGGKVETGTPSRLQPVRCSRPSPPPLPPANASVPPCYTPPPARSGSAAAAHPGSPASPRTSRAPPRQRSALLRSPPTPLSLSPTPGAAAAPPRRQRGREGWREGGRRRRKGDERKPLAGADPTRTHIPAPPPGNAVRTAVLSGRCPPAAPAPGSARCPHRAGCRGRSTAQLAKIRPAPPASAPSPEGSVSIMGCPRAFLSQGNYYSQMVFCAWCSGYCLELFPCL